MSHVFTPYMVIPGHIIDGGNPGCPENHAIDHWPVMMENCNWTKPSQGSEPAKVNQVKRVN